MTKLDFLEKLYKGLSALPKSEREASMTFYSEMIDDLIEEGYSEEDAVSKIGSVEDIISQISADAPPPEKKKKTTRRLRGREIILLILGAPLWIPLMITGFTIMLSIYISVWAIIVSVWAVFASVTGCALGGFLGGLVLCIFHFPLSGAILIASGFILAGISILMFFTSLLLTKLMIKFSKLIFTSRRCA